MKTSRTPALARKSRVYSINGVFTSGRRHYGVNVSMHRECWGQAVRSYSRSFKGEGLETSFEDVSEHLNKSDVRLLNQQNEVLVYEQ